MRLTPTRLTHMVTTNAGGESIYGGPFADEFHSRLRFAHRGIVAMANENVKDSNGSQVRCTAVRYAFGVCA
jgi:peptidyl-prolyl cis-trans isomerase SDCCAG10